MRFCRFSFSILLLVLFFVSAALAANVKVDTQRVVTTNYDHVLKIANENIFESIPLNISGVQSTSLKLPSLSKNLELNIIEGSFSKLNLLNIDELWVNYRPVSSDNSCFISGNLNVLGVPLNTSKLLPQSSVNLNISNGENKIHGDKIFLSGEVKARKVDYLIRRHIGLYANTDWNFVNEGNLSVFMKLMRINMKNISFVDFEMDSAVERVNFRLSRNSSGKPTDIIEWQDIPKVIVDHGSTRLVRLDFSSVIRKNIPNAFDQDLPLNLVEIIAFIDKDSIATGVAPVNWIQSYYDVPVKEYQNSVVRVLSYTERVNSNLWRWRLSMASLRQLPFEEIFFISGKITYDLPSCISSFDHAEMVILKPPTMTRANNDANNQIPILQNASFVVNDSSISYLSLPYLISVLLLVLAFFFWRYSFALKLVLVDFIGDFIIQNLQMLNVLLVSSYLLYVLHSSNRELIAGLSITNELFGLLFFIGFSFLHAWRWRLQSSLSEISKVKSDWIVGQDKSPSRASLLLTALILIIMIYLQWHVLFKSTDEYNFATNFKYSEVFGYLEIVALRLVLVLIEQFVYLPFMLSIVYGLSPWILRYVCMLFSPSARIWQWVFVTIMLYVIGLKDIARPDENYYFTFGALTLVFALRYLMLSFENYFRENYPLVADIIYAGSGSIYLSVAVVMLVATAAVLSVNLQLVAEQLAIVSYYCLVIGTLLELVAVRRANKIHYENTSA